MTAGPGGLPADELRSLIREVLRDALPALIDGRPGQLPSPAAAPPPLAAGPPLPAAPPPLPATPPLGVPAGVVPAGAAGGPQAGGPAGPPAQAAAVRPVRLETNEDLREFALELMRLADNPARRQDLVTGRLRFTLARGDDGASGPAEQRIDKGAVTERSVQDAARAGRRLVLGPRAVLTPLARDRALALGVPIEKER
jgi:hypothetical protein